MSCSQRDVKETDHELFIILTDTACLQKKVILECHLGHGTEFVPLTWRNLTTDRRTRTCFGNKPLTSLPVIAHLDVKGHQPAYGAAFTVFVQESVFGTCCFLLRETINKELLSCPVLNVFQCLNRSENSHPPNAELQQL